MDLAFDHIVVSVPALAPAIAQAEAAGFTVRTGGRHSEIPTENALIAFADGGYIELLAARTAMNRVAAQRLVRGPEWEQWAPRIDAVGRRFLPHLARVGVCDLALHGPGLGAIAAAARARGERPEGPTDMGRARPDGRALAWQILVHDTLELPFMIADGTPRAWRVPADPADVVHANGATGVECVTVNVHDADAALGRWRSWSGASVGTGDRAAGIVMDLRGLRVRLVQGVPIGAVGATLHGIRSRDSLAPVAHWGITAAC